MKSKEWTEEEFQKFMEEERSTISDEEIEAEALRILAEAENDPDYQAL